VVTQSFREAGRLSRRRAANWKFLTNLAPRLNNPHYVANVMKNLLDRGIRTADVTPAAVANWSDVITAGSAFSVDAARNCTPGWANNDGSYEPGQPNAFANAYGGGPVEYVTVLEKWRNGPFEQDLKLEFAASETTGGNAR
jgi:hypothetical protein